MVDVIKLKGYKDTGKCDDTLTLNIEGMYVAAAESNNIDDFTSICTVFKKEYFDLVDQLTFQKKNATSDEVLLKKIELGKNKLKVLCNIARD